jgi:hypothetical protein
MLPLSRWFNNRFIALAAASLEQASRTGVVRRGLDAERDDGVTEFLDGKGPGYRRCHANSIIDYGTNEQYPQS